MPDGRKRRHTTGGDYAPSAVAVREGQLGGAARNAVERSLRRGATRITNINDFTRESIRKLIAEAIEQGMSPAEAGEYVRQWSGFDEYRAERIARTEMTTAYNMAALDTYGELGVTQVVADDGDEDEECAERHGQVFDVDEAESIEDHPNGTLDWLPVADGIDARQVQSELDEKRPIGR